MPSTSFPSSRECGRAASDAFSSPLGAKIVTCRCWSRLLERGIRRGAVGVEGGSRMHLECTRWRTHGWSDAHMTSDVGRMLRRKLTRAFCRVSPRDFARRVSSATRARSRTGLTRVTSVPIWARSGPSPSPAALTPRGSFLRRSVSSPSSPTPLCASAFVCSSSRTARRSLLSFPTTVASTSSMRTTRFSWPVSVAVGTPRVTFPVFVSRSPRCLVSPFSLSSRRRRRSPVRKDWVTSWGYAVESTKHVHRTVVGGGLQTKGV